MRIVSQKNGKLLVILNLNGVKVNFEVNSKEEAFDSVNKIFKKN